MTFVAFGGILSPNQGILVTKTDALGFVTVAVDVPECLIFCFQLQLQSSGRAFKSLIRSHPASFHSRLLHVHNRGFAAESGLLLMNLTEVMRRGMLKCSSLTRAQHCLGRMLFE